MSLADAVVALMIIGLTAYAVLAGADFGTGAWDLIAGRGERGREVRRLVESSMGPVWEANHVWLIFVLVVFWTSFPVAFGSVASTLYVPLFLAVVGIVLRGTAFATRGVTGAGAKQGYDLLFAGSSVLTPFFLGAAAGGIASGRVPLGNAAGDALTSWWNPTSVLTGVIAVVTGAHLAAVYLGADAARTGKPELVAAFRTRALVSGVVAGGLAMGGLLVLREDARPLYDGLTGDALWLVGLSALAGVVTLVLVWRGRLGIARATGAIAVGAIVWGWAVAQRPDLLPGQITIEEAAAGRPTLIAVLVAMGAGAVILIPSLAYLFSLVLTGRLDEDPGPEDEPAPLP